MYFAHEPSATRLAYRFSTRGVAGLRLVDDTLDLLDAGGAPRIRVEPRPT